MAWAVRAPLIAWVSVVAIGWIIQAVLGQFSGGGAPLHALLAAAASVAMAWVLLGVAHQLTLPLMALACLRGLLTAVVVWCVLKRVWLWR